MIEHDASPGRLGHCQITGSPNLNLVIDLGHQPPCDSLLTAEMLDAPEKTYPLRLMHCPESGLAQLDYIVDGFEIYYPDYPYRSGISWPLERYQRAFADRIVARFAIGSDALCVDIGSNDGTLLTGFKRHGCNPTTATRSLPSSPISKSSQVLRAAERYDISKRVPLKSDIQSV